MLFFGFLPWFTEIHSNTEALKILMEANVQSSLLRTTLQTLGEVYVVTLACCSSSAVLKDGADICFLPIIWPNTYNTTIRSFMLNIPSTYAGTTTGSQRRLSLHQRKVTYFHTPHSLMCWHICGLYVCVCTQSHHNNSSGHRLISLHHQCNILFFSSSADCLKRDSHEVIHSSLDAITWLVAEQLLYTVTQPS